MQSLIAEQPLLLALMLAAIAAALLFGWLQTGTKPPLVAAAIVLLLIPLGWFVSVRWVTDREQIRAVIDRTVAAVNANDVDGVLQAIEPHHRELLQAARADLSRFHFSEARVTQVRSLNLVSGSDPPEAQADLTARVLVSDRGGNLSEVAVARRVILDFRKLGDGNWYIHDYNHLPLIGPPDGYSPRR